MSHYLGERKAYGVKAGRVELPEEEIYISHRQSMRERRAGQPAHSGQPFIFVEVGDLKARRS
jgi:hypothetical protein